MTNDKVIEMYSRFLEEVVGCSPDEYGNHPCDWGVPCDRCMADDYQSIWKKEFYTALEKEADRHASKEY